MYVAICGPFAELTVHDVYLKKVEEGNIRFGGYYVIEDTKEESKKFIEAVWRQYAQAFNNSYDEHLIFENFNEPIHIKHDHAWMPDPDCAECKKDFALLNEYNQLIVPRSSWPVSSRTQATMLPRPQSAETSDR